MALPTPNQGEKRPKFMGRCLRSDEIKSEFSEQKKRFSVCAAQWMKGK